jgi:hypothetical protein
MARKTKLAAAKGTFTLNNNLLTIRYWSQSFTTSLFDKEVKDYVLICQYPIHNFNLEILKNFSAALLYLDIGKKVYIARVKEFAAAVNASSVVLHLVLSNIRLKSAFDLEWASPSSFYEQILADKKFFKIAGKDLEGYVKPLGLSKKPGETDQAFRRRTLEYINFKTSNTSEALSEADFKQLRGDTDEQ